MKKIKILKTWIFSGKKYNAGDIVEIPEKVYNSLVESKFPFEDIKAKEPK